MRYVLGPAKGAVFLMVTYLFAFGSATQYASPYQDSFVGWAAYQGQTLLLRPGIEYVLRTKGEDYILNAPPNDVMATELGIGLALAAILGLAVGLVWSAVAPAPKRADGNGPAASALPVVAVVLAVVSGLGGLVPGYAAFLIGTWALRAGGTRRQRIASRFAQVLGALTVTAWAIGLAMEFRSSPLD